MARQHDGLRSLSISTILLSVGQLFLLLVAPLTRASGTFSEIRGLAILVPDSKGYLQSAASLEGVFSWQWMRVGYPFLLYVVGIFGDPAQLIIVVHVIALLVAATMLQSHLDGLVGGVPATFATAVLLVNPMTAQWVRIVTTESVFFALVIIISVLSHKILAGSRSPTIWVGYFTAACFALITRPNGIFVLSSALALLLVACMRGRVRVLALVSFWLIVLAVLPAFNAAVGPPSEGSLTSQLYDGVVVEGTDHVRVTIEMPTPREATDESSTAAIRYAVEHPLATMRLGTTRVAYETLQMRPHYPAVVNIAFGAAMLAYLIAAALGWRQPGARISRSIFLTLGIPLLLLTAATFAVPESRYGWAYLLPLAPLSTFGIARVLPRLVQHPGGASGPAAVDTGLGG